VFAFVYRLLFAIIALSSTFAIMLAS
jgi:hypothetical protein